MGRTSEKGKEPAKRKDETAAAPSPLTPDASPLDVKGVKANVTTEEIVRAVRQSRRR